ncbi:glutaredoxin [Natronospirillum operosum]|uniref:Glutaredoxin n=1 Tax=Natronospirillum operosum TaxID=2759953 RepID=A0A4Z0WAD8_9GAMM|nr:glutathione S-transferase N-terminal domain-containing protein [Natronospirillum operosum]TGG90267.1 glutaredoxin [Natronospirillum operosum]
MRVIIIRFFFRTLGLILTPVMLLSEKLTTPKPIKRSAEAQAAVDKACDNLALYQFRACPFCIKVRKEMARLALPIEVRDPQLDPKHKEALIAGGGRGNVPCLRIGKDDPQATWMYESDDIINWLQKEFATE